MAIITSRMAEYQALVEAATGVQTVTLTVPLLIRLLEFAREDATDDLVLHRVAERLAARRHAGMEHYGALIAEGREPGIASRDYWNWAKSLGPSGVNAELKRLKASLSAGTGKEQVQDKDRAAGHIEQLRTAARRLGYTVTE